MANALVIQVAEAVVDVLNAADLGVTVTAARSYLTLHDLPLSAGLAVTVVPSGYQAHVFDLAPRLVFDCEAEVWVQQRVADSSNDPADPLVGLAEAAIVLFLGKPLAGVPGARCVGAAHQPSLHREAFDKLGLFSAAVTLTFRVTR